VPGTGRLKPGETKKIFAGVRLTHPDRVLYPEREITKRELAGYYERRFGVTVGLHKNRRRSVNGVVGIRSGAG
jgi:DNA primase